MTEKQYKKYQQIEKEIAPIKNFLSWSGKRYKDGGVFLYRFSIKRIGAKFGLYMHRDFCDITENTLELPIELQGRIIEVVEKYVDEKQKQLDEI